MTSSIGSGSVLSGKSNWPNLSCNMPAFPRASADIVNTLRNRTPLNLADVKEPNSGSKYLEILLGDKLPAKLSPLDKWLVAKFAVVSQVQKKSPDLAKEFNTEELTAKLGYANTIAFLGRCFQIATVKTSVETKDENKKVEAEKIAKKAEAEKIAAFLGTALEEMRKAKNDDVDLVKLPFNKALIAAKFVQDLNEAAAKQERKQLLITRAAVGTLVVFGLGASGYAASQYVDPKVFDDITNVDYASYFNFDFNIDFNRYLAMVGLGSNS